MRIATTFTVTAYPRVFPKKKLVPKTDSLWM